MKNQKCGLDFIFEDYSKLHRYQRIHKVFLIICTLFLWVTVMGCNNASELKWNSEEGYRWADLSTGYFDRTGFRSLSPSQTGIDFTNNITEAEIDENRHYLNGSGVAAGDIDGDGLVDLYFAGLNNSNKLYKNLGGLKFEDITEQSGVAHKGVYSTGAVFSDVNGNGHLDLLITAMYGENALYINDGTGNFHYQENSGLGAARGSNTMTLADLTGNGYPDLYISRYKEKSVKDIYTTEELDWSNILAEPLRQPTDSYTLVPPFDKHYELVRQNGALTGVTEIGEVDELYLNKEGKFEKVTDTKNIFLDERGQPFGLQPDWGLTAKFHDLNNDGHQDLYVCNDFHTPDRIWINQGDGTFQAIGWQAIRNLSYSCMAVDFSDVNRDSRVDIFTTEMRDPEHQRRLSQIGSQDHMTIPVGNIESKPMYNRNSMYLQREDGTFAETAWINAVQATGWSWGTRFMDIDLDGFEDLIVATGYLYNILDIDAQYTMIQNRRNMDEHFMEFVKLVEPLKQQNKFLRNNGIESANKVAPTFTDVSSNWGFKDKDISQGMAVADLNNDGTLDIIINRMNNEAVIYENKTRAPRIAIRLKGRSPNTQALGAKVELTGGPINQQKEITAGGDYASGSDLMMMFAANSSNQNHKIQITWPDGSQSKLEGIKANRIYEIDQANIRSQSRPDVSNNNDIKTSLFKDISGNLPHRHHEDSFDDFRVQPLLPFKLSQQGPGIAWLDLNGNGKNELLIGSGKGGKLNIFENTGNGKFEHQYKEIEDFLEVATGDQTAIIGWKEDNYTRLLIGSSNYEERSSNTPSLYNFKINRDGNIAEDPMSANYSTTGPLAAADVTGNGYLDLFVGGNFKPGQYPADADSRFYSNDGGVFKLHKKNTQLLAGLGLVNGAVFSDFNRDGNQDLVVSTEWGSLRLFEFKEGVITERTKEVGLDKYSGGWKGVSAGDFNNDGLPDIVAANFGLNTPYQIKNESPLRIYYQDPMGIGRMDIIEAYANEEGNYLPRRRLYNFHEQQVMLNRMRSHKEFSSSTLREILGSRYNQTPFKEINTLQHMVFLNTGDGFKAHPLPQMAQLSMVFHPGIGDFDNDGNEDLFLSQNFFAVNEEVHRMDAGRGLILRGDGDGNFIPLTGTESGIKIYGEQRSASLSDINEDGRVDLVVSQNGAQTRIFQNQTVKTGYSVKLQGPPSNRDAVGSGIRLVYQNGEKGPRRDVRSGGGYWSHSSYNQIMGAQNQVKEIEVFWFDGSHQTIPVLEGKKVYEIFHSAYE